MIIVKLTLEEDIENTQDMKMPVLVKGVANVEVMAKVEKG